MINIITCVRLFRVISFVSKNSKFATNFKCLTCHNFHTSNYLFKKRKTEEEKISEKHGRRIIKVKEKKEVLDIWRNMTIKEIATVLNKDIDHVYETMLYVKDAENYNYDDVIIDNPKVIQSILNLNGYRYRIISKPVIENLIEKKIEDAVRGPLPLPANLQPRPPVVTIMGHIDHGKTTLLDALRNTNVVDSEFGGITQHIGAFSVTIEDKEKITFLDTPGHAAFSAMRERGANVTDMVVLVVASDDGVMEQTVESIRMARDANVPIIVAINKIDKSNADIERTKKMLAQQSILVEDLSGDIQAISISALKSINLNNLVEAILLQSQIMELKSDPTGYVEGVIIESQTDVKRGRLATAIIQRGTLRKGCIIVAGLGFARVRGMFSSDGSPCLSAPPSTPVQIIGWKELPSAGDTMIEVSSEKRATEVIKLRTDNKMLEKQIMDAPAIATKEAEHKAEYYSKLKQKRLLGRFVMKNTGPREKMIIKTNEPRLNIIIKGDVDGSVDAILDVLETYECHDQCKLDVVHYGIGNVSEGDLDLAETFNAIIYGFNITYSPNIADLIKRKKISVKKCNVIYKMIDDIKEEINLRIPLIQKEEILGEANVLQNFEVNEKRKKVNVAGCRCTRGVLKKKTFCRAVRGLDVVFEGKLDSMRHLKEEVESIKSGVECGLKMSDSTFEFKPGDVIICYHMVDQKCQTNWDPGF